MRASVFLVSSLLLSVNERQSVNSHPESKRRTRKDVLCVCVSKRFTNIYKGERKEMKTGEEVKNKKKKKKEIKNRP